MVLKEGGLLSLCVCISVPLSSMVLVGVLMVLKEGELLFLCVCVGVPDD